MEPPPPPQPPYKFRKPPLTPLNTRFYRSFWTFFHISNTKFALFKRPFRFFTIPSDRNSTLSKTHGGKSVTRIIKYYVLSSKRDNDAKDVRIL